MSDSAKRKTTTGFIGRNSKGTFATTVGGKPVKSYGVWRQMINRCTNAKIQMKYPSYIGCSVCDEWLDYQNFAEWYEANSSSGNDLCLDKDLKVIGNKIYSPETCMMVSNLVNTFTTDRASLRGDYKIGVSWCKTNKKFRASCNNPKTRKVETLGYFDRELDAHNAWRSRKGQLAMELYELEQSEDVRLAILRWKDALDNYEIHN